MVIHTLVLCRAILIGGRLTFMCVISCMGYMHARSPGSSLECELLCYWKGTIILDFDWRSFAAWSTEFVEFVSMVWLLLKCLMQQVYTDSCGCNEVMQLNMWTILLLTGGIFGECSSTSALNYVDCGLKFSLSVLEKLVQTTWMFQYLKIKDKWNVVSSYSYMSI